MKKAFEIPLYVLAILATSCISVSDDGRTKPAMSKSQVIELANREARWQDVDLGRFEEPGAEYESLRNKDHMWSVFYDGKTRAPGNHFFVWVDDRTGKCRLVPGA